ncbi:MAG TPA: GNAT family N-acetyltransferase [Gaiellaceae bacterium]|nr:GNAT family N-acetyltransferase [Gaiellaceae bacterium]
MNVRAITPDDLESIAALLREDEEALYGTPSPLAANDLREYLSRTKLETDSWLYEADGVMVAVGWCDGLPGSDVAFAAGAVRQGWKGRGLGSELVARSEACARGHGVARIHQFALGADTAARSLFESRGYRDVRHFFHMAIELEERPDVPELAIESMTETDLEAFHAALEESFRDHWEHHPTSFEDWWARHRANPNLDLGLWFLVRDGDEIAAVARNEANRNGGGYVGALGVRRPWRGKGYAKALLLHTFREFWDRGLRRVTLGVDASNPTGATHLYERVGMHVEQENVVFEKTIA